MASYAGLDVAEQATHVCVVDETGKVVFRGVCRTEPAALHELLARRAPQLGRAVLETGALASWLVHGLTALGVPAVCVCARQAHAALQHGPCKTDRADAEGLARLAQTGWLKEVHVRSLASHEAKSLVIARERLVHIRQDLVNLIRGLLKPFGILTGRIGAGRFDARIRELAADRPLLLAALDPLLTIRLRILDQIALLDEQLLGLAKDDEACRRLMTIPGVGHLTARTFMAVIDDPGRFRSSQEVGAYLGLVPRRWQSGQVDQAGGITRCGDGLLRHLLYECANVIVSILKKPCALKAWAERLEARIGARKARVALARKLAVLMHRLWANGEAYDGQRQPHAA
jgi:transposase